MADFISALTGVQMDQALMDMAEHNSEAYAVGERNGVAVGEGDVTYQNNAKYYAQIATSHIEPGEIGDAVRWDTDQSTVLTDANKAQARSNINAASDSDVVKITAQTLTSAQQEQARANIMAGGSNDNLLDNSYFVGGGSQLGDGIFPINQRGQSSYASDGAGIDRWKQFSATVTLASDGVTVTPSAYSNNFLQLMNPAKWDALVGETVTFSIEVLAITGTIIFAGYNTGIGTITSTGIATFTFTMPSGIADGNKFFGLAGQSGTSIKFGRWKLEKGSISTLANDVPPDFGAVRRKCQQYLWVYKVGANTTIGSGTTFGTSSAIDIVTPVPMMAGNVTASFNVTPYIVYDGGLGLCDAGAAIITNNGTGNHLRWQIGHSGTNIQGHSLVMLLAGNETTFTFSNEL